MNNQIYDVLIVGAGPAGCFTAYNLAKNGFSVALIENQKDLKRKLCGEYLCPKGVSLIKQYELNFLLDDFLPLYGMDVYNAYNTHVHTDFPNFNNTQLGCSLNRQIFDSRLLKLARDSSTDIFMDTNLKDFSYTQDVWTIETSKGQLKSRLLIGADGRRSKVAEILGVQIASKQNRVALHYYYNIPSGTNPRYGEMHLFKDGSYIGIDPTGKQEINFSLVCDAKAIKTHKTPQSTFNHYISQSENLKNRFAFIHQTDKVQAVTPIQSSVSASSGVRWALVGDANGFVDPLTGEGIYNALLTADLLSKELIAVKKQQDWQPALYRYQKSTKKIMNEKKKLNTFFQWLIKHPRLVEGIARYLLKSKNKADAFIGIIGNIYRPLQGIYILLTCK